MRSKHKWLKKGKKKQRPIYFLCGMTATKNPDEEHGQQPGAENEHTDPEVQNHFIIQVLCNIPHHTHLYAIGQPIGFGAEVIFCDVHAV